MLVTKNSLTALRCLRLEDRTRALWMDAICINQKSAHEQSHQVNIVNDIYKRVTQVLAWLGEADKQIASALRHFWWLGFILYLRSNVQFGR